MATFRFPLPRYARLAPRLCQSDPRRKALDFSRLAALAMKPNRPATRSELTHRSEMGRQTESDARCVKRQREVRTSWAAGILSLVLGASSLAYFQINCPPFQGRGAKLANALYAQFGPIGPALVSSGQKVGQYSGAR